MHTRGVPYTPQVRISLARIFIALCLAITLASCGGGGGGTMNPTTPPPLAPINLAVAGMAVIKVQDGAQGVTLMSEKLTSLSEFGPERSITLLDTAPPRAAAIRHPLAGR